MLKYVWRFAPHTGAWIETPAGGSMMITVASHPTRVRGLKPCAHQLADSIEFSHPTRVRGLKRL
mgnify:CR=1 FL=1